jgi:sugar diacid utilization regulator
MKVKDVLEFGGLADAKVVAGIEGLNNNVETVTVLEVFDFATGNWVFENQLLISALYSIKDDINAQKDMIKELSKVGTAGLVICHLDFWLKNIDDSVVDMCNELGFPLILAESDTAYTDIIIPINDRLLKIYAERHKYSLEIQSKLIELIIANNDIYDICKFISQASKSSVVILDINNNSVASSRICIDNTKKIEIFCKNSFNRIKEEHLSSVSTVAYLEGKKYIIQPIVSGLEYFGLIVLEDHDGSNKEFSNLQIIVKYACVAVALISTKKQRFEKMQDIYFRDYLADLFTWNFKNEETAIKRGRLFNWDIKNKKLLVLININSVFGKNEMFLEEDSFGDYAKDYLIPAIIEYANGDNEKNLVGYRSDNIIVLIEDDKNEASMYKRARIISNKFLEYCSGKIEISISIGISNCYRNIPDIANAYKEALTAMDMGRDSSGENKFCSYSELGYIPYLKSQDYFEINEKIRDYFLESLLKYDEMNNTELIETLKNLLFHDLNVAEVSEKMYIHRNTLLARKKRIIEILEHNPFEMPYKLNYLMVFSIKK